MLPHSLNEIWQPLNSRNPPRPWADGQLPASSATLFSATATPASGSVNRVLSIALFNTSTTAIVTLILTVTPSTGTTARNIIRGLLAPLEAMRINGLQIGASDVLSGYASADSTVDYQIGNSNSGEFNVQTYRSPGSPAAESGVKLVALKAKRKVNGRRVTFSGPADENAVLLRAG